MKDTFNIPFNSDMIEKLLSDFLTNPKSDKHDFIKVITTYVKNNHDLGILLTRATCNGIEDPIYQANTPIKIRSFIVPYPFCEAHSKTHNLIDGNGEIIGVIVKVNKYSEQPYTLKVEAYNREGKPETFTFDTHYEGYITPVEIIS
jgi:hypothetical protein